jgi:TolB-like protein/DNA-binding winged helix-turn-helix (wHTH) protein/Tfp pilus assembly protein PilF
MAKPSEPTADVVQFGDFALDLRAGELWRDGGARVLLAAQPFRLLASLVRRPGELVTREALRRELWADDTFVDFEHGLNSAIKRLRVALGDSGTAPRYIETLPRRGYRFIAPVEPFREERTALGGIRDPAPLEERAAELPRGRSGRSPWALAGGLAATGVIITALLAHVWGPIGGRPSPIVVVLPFTNLSAGTDSDAFADGLTDEIIRSLAVIQGLQVRSRTSSFEFKNAPRNLREVGRQLGATLVVEGSVLGTGTKKRVNAQLIDVATDVPLWAGRFDRDITSSSDVMFILDEISRAIVNKMRLTLGRGQRRYDLDLETYELYLHGRAMISRGGVPNLEKAAEIFQQVLDRDAAFAPAQAGLANAYALMSEPTSSQFPFENALSMVRLAALKARELDPMLAEAHAAMGWAYARELEWASAEKSFDRAIQLDPSLTQTYTSYSISTLQPLEKFDAALRILRVALRNDPLSLEVQREIGHLQMLAGRYREAVGALERVRRIDATFPFVEIHLARALTFAGRPAEALSLLERLDGRHLGRFKAAETRRPPWLANAYVMTGRRAEAEALVAENVGVPSGLAVIHAALGDPDRAFAALEQMALVEPHHVPRMLVQPEMAGLRGDARFTALRQRFHLASP